MSRLPRLPIEPLESRILLAATPVPLRINAGGPAVIDSLARPFEADSGFTGGAVVTAAPGVAGDNALFASYRTGAAFTFSRAVANGHYNLFLEFADPASTAPGQRAFDVFAEGDLRLDGFDVYKEITALGTSYPYDAPGGNALAKSFELTVTDGRLDLAFAGVVGDAIISAINLIPTDVPDAAKPYVLSHGHFDDSTQIGQARNDALKVRSASNLRTLGQAILWYANETKNNLPPDLRTLAVSMGVLADPFTGPRTDTNLPRGDLSYVEHVAWASQLQDYLYLGAGKKLGANAAQMPLVYENPDRVVGQIVVLFADGHVEYLDRSVAAARIGFADAPPSDPPPTQDPLEPALRADPNVFDSQANLRTIGRTMLLYANENRGIYPTTPGVLIYFGGTYTGLSAQTFVNRRGTTTPPPSDLSLADGAAWIDASRDYVYLGAGKRSYAPADAVLAFENPAEMIVGLNFLMGDGHVEFREMRWAMETIARAGATSRLPKPGDANRDGSVDFADLLAVARNFGKSDQPFTHGDFNYDGTVNFADLLILARNYNPASTVVGAVAASAPVLAATATPDRRDPLKPDVLSARPSVAVKPTASPAAKARR